jgi:hypothetical protein
MAAAAHLNPAGGRKDDGSEVVRTLKAPRASGVFPDARPEGFSILEKRTEDDRARRADIINHPPSIGQKDIPDEVTNWFHAVEDEYQEQVEDLIRMCEDADRERNAIADELVNLEKQLSHKVHTLLAKRMECDRLVEQASDTKDKEAPPLLDDAIAREMAKLKQKVTAKNALNKTMQATLAAALQEVEATKKALATAEDERDMTSEKIESVMVELNATN